MCYMLFKPLMGVFKYVWGSFFHFRKLFIAMLVLQEHWFSVWNLSGATDAWQESYKVDGYLVRIL